MSKAIYGHLGGPDPRLVAEIGRLRRRVAELEAQVAAYEAELVRLPAVELPTLDGPELDVALREPALT